MADIYDVIIIGAGPAGYTAGIYSARGGHNTIVISGMLPGGQLVNTTEVENYPGFEKGILGPDLMNIMRKQAENMGAKIEDSTVVNVNFKKNPFKIATSKKEFLGKAVIIATGANPRKLGIKGEKEFSGRGVSYCALCDGPLFKGKALLVIGGGDTAMEESNFLSKFATKVHLVHRRDKFKASRIMQERTLKNKKIQIHWDTEVEEIQGTQMVEKVVLKNNKTNERTTLDIGGIFVAIGHEPNTSLFSGHIKLDKKGYIIVKNNTETSVKGVFAAGDVHDHKYRQAVTAAGFGCMAAIEADEYLNELKK